MKFNSATATVISDEFEEKLITLFRSNDSVNSDTAYQMIKGLIKNGAEINENTMDWLRFYYNLRFEIIYDKELKILERHLKGYISERLWEKSVVLSRNSYGSNTIIRKSLKYSNLLHEADITLHDDLEIRYAATKNSFIGYVNSHEFYHNIREIPLNKKPQYMYDVFLTQKSLFRKMAWKRFSKRYAEFFSKATKEDLKPLRTQIMSNLRSRNVWN